MVLFTGLWHQFEAKTQQQIQIEQVVASLQLSIRPLLEDKDTALLHAQLNQLRYTSAVPLTAIAIFNQNHRLLAGTELPEALHQFKPMNLVSDFSVQPFQNMLLALQPISPTEHLLNSLEEQSSTDDKYYLLLLFEPVTTYSIWLIPIIIVGLLGGLVLILLQNNLQQHAQRQHIDVSLLSHKLSQMRDGQHNVSLSEEVVPELAPLKQAFNELAQYQTESQAHTQQAYLLQQQEIEQAHQQLAELQQQYNVLQHNCTVLEQSMQNSVVSLRQLLQLQSELSEEEFAQALSAQLCLLQCEFGTVTDVDSHLRLTDFIAQQVPQLRCWLAERNIELQLFEQANNAAYELQISAEQLSALLFALVKIGSRAVGVAELTLRVTLDTQQEHATLQLGMTGDGDGMSARLRQLLNSNDIRALQWHESDIGIFITLKRQLDARMTVQSLEGLGCTVTMMIPGLVAAPVSSTTVQHLLVFDSIAASLTERVQNIEAAAAHIAKCNDLSELEMKSKQFVYDVILVMLPEPAELSLWREVLQALSTRGQLLCYAIPSQLEVWRQALQLEVLAAPFCLADIEKVEREEDYCPRLLVVDDNPTNLAFVQVLLKEQPVLLSTANCGTEALKLCQQQQFDVILLDIQLPDIDGVEVTRQLRQLAEYQETPILAFTAHALEEEVSEFLRAGMNDVIFKPLEASKLEQILRWCSVRETDNTSQ
jgi:two-component system, NarL family, sensor histidine kinase BarA